MRHLIFSISTFLIVIFTHPQLLLAKNLNQEIAICSSIEGELERLDCFDNLAQGKGLDKPQDVTGPIDDKGKWNVSVKVNPIDDSETVVLYLEADSGKSKWGKSPIMIMRCQSNKTELFINWDNYLGSDAYVLTRIGSEKAVTKEWSLSSDKKASFYPTSPISFIKNMMEQDKFVAQVTPYSESPVTAVFDTVGLKNAVKPLQKTCNWE